MAEINKRDTEMETKEEEKKVILFLEDLEVPDRSEEDKIPLDVILALNKLGFDCKFRSTGVNVSDMETTERVNKIIDLVRSRDVVVFKEYLPKESNNRIIATLIALDIIVDASTYLGCNITSRQIIDRLTIGEEQQIRDLIKAPTKVELVIKNQFTCNCKKENGEENGSK